MAGSSFGHRVRLLTAAEQHQYSDGRWDCGMRRDGKRCARLVTHAQSYSYVTGRAGRVSSSERLVCAEHAKRFAEKNNLEMPEMPEDLKRRAAAARAELVELLREIGDELPGV